MIIKTANTFEIWITHAFTAAHWHQYNLSIFANQTPQMKYNHNYIYFLENCLLIQTILLISTFCIFSANLWHPSSSAICPEGYEIGYNYGCYRFVTDSKDWDDARMDCMSTPNGDLAVVDTQDEMNFFIEKGFGGYDWWVGEYKIILKYFLRWFLLPVCFLMWAEEWCFTPCDYMELDCVYQF